MLIWSSFVGMECLKYVMVNQVFLNGVRVSEIIEINGRSKAFRCEDGTVIPEIRRPNAAMEMECAECKDRRRVSSITTAHRTRVYTCFTCHSKGKRNPFYGRHHTEQMKEQLRRDRKGKVLRPDNRANYDIWVTKYGKVEADRRNAQYRQKMSAAHSGENNPMFGKKLTPDQIKRSKEGIAKWRASLTEEQKQEISQRAKEEFRRIREKNPKRFSELRAKAGRASMAAQYARMKMNRIEEIVAREMKRRGLDGFEFSVYMGRHQFDFGHKGKRVLLEVQGDYWHCNPAVYKQPKNDVQRAKLEKDRAKREFAVTHAFALYYIWEKDINAGNFAVLDEIRAKHFIAGNSEVAA
jgi:very-short-patch-repair endonuclease